jgi:hypothetical protein
MRQITEQEAREWIELAEAYGFYDKDRGLALGRFIVNDADNKSMELRFITPVIASEFSDTLEKKTPPIMFDRTDSGEIILPGRWWQRMFEKVASGDHDQKMRGLAHRAARGGLIVADTYVPREVETIQILSANDNGEMVPFEALPPGGTIRLAISRG